jgi:hypothetical protein
LGYTPEQISGMNTQPGQAGTNQGQTNANMTAGGLPPNETYVGDAFDTELATTPERAEDDVLQSEEQEIEQTKAVARDMVQAEDQGVVRVPPESSGQQNQE